MPDSTAPLVEVFSGIQGEGILVGTRQIFVRLAGCNRACRFCDTPESRQAPAACAVEQRPGSRSFAWWPNPLSVGQVVEAVAALQTPGPARGWVSLTGGEPLLHCEFLAALCAALHTGGLGTCLETNGTLPDAFEPIAGAFDHVAMDIKLASATGEPTDWDAHRRFLELAPRGGTQVKAVIASATADEELRRVAELVAAVDSATPVVLQPVTPVGGVVPPSPRQVLALQGELLARLPDVRVIPQVHRLMDQK